MTNPQSWNLYTYVGNAPLVSVDPLGLSECSLSVGISFPDSTTSSLRKTIESRLQGLFGPDISLSFVVGGRGEVNVAISAAMYVPGAGGTPAAGEVPTINGVPSNSGIVDFGQLLSYQYGLGGPQGQTRRLGMALGQVAAHELAHELYLPDYRNRRIPATPR